MGKGMKQPKKRENPISIKDLILEESRKGNIVIMGIEGPMVANLEEFIRQPTTGLLYDLNRLPEVILTFIDNPKWINDYAVSLVISKLKSEFDKRAIMGAMGKEGSDAIKPES